MKQHFLLIEDDLIIAEFMGVVLMQNGYHIINARSGMEALTALQSESFDLILLDLGLPDIDGIELLKMIRKSMLVPIIVVSARNNETEKVQALDFGADDYVTKPFGTNELLARIRTALRHKQNDFSDNPVIETNHLKINLEKQVVYKNDVAIHLTKNEYRILALLFRQLGKVVTHQSLMTQIWGPFANDSQTLRVNMSNIRKKIEDDTLHPEYLVTEIGVGYRLREYSNTSNYSIDK